MLTELVAAVDGGGYTSGAPHGLILEVKSEEVSLPVHGAVVGLEAVVPPAVAACLAEPGAFELPADEWPEERPGCVTHVSQEDA